MRLSYTCVLILGAVPLLTGFDSSLSRVPVEDIVSGRPPERGIPAIVEPNPVSARRARLREQNRSGGIARHAPEGDAVGTAAAAVASHSAYWLDTRSIFVGDERDEMPALLVIRGELRNTGGQVLHHVRLAYDLLDDEGRVVASEAGYNVGAQRMRPVDAEAGTIPAASTKVKPVPAGGSDGFHKVIAGGDVPAFTRYRVRVVEAEHEGALQPTRRTSVTQSLGQP